MSGAASTGADPRPSRRGGRGRARLLWGIVVPALLVAGLGWFVWREWETFARIRDAPAGDLLLIAVLFAVAHLLNSTEFWLLYRATGTRFRLMENWMLFTAGQLANHLPGQVGTLYRLRYMRSVHAVPYLHSAAVYGANLVITVAAAALVGLGGVLSSAAFGGRSVSKPLLLLFAAMAGGAALFAVSPLPALQDRTGWLARFWHRFHAGFEEIRTLPSTALAVAVLEAVKYALTAWRIQVTFSLIGIHEPIWVFLVLAPAAGIASFIAVTPAALGFREAFVTGAAAAMGIEATAGLLGATVDRAVMLATFLVLGGIGLLVTYPGFHAASVPDGPRTDREGP